MLREILEDGSITRLVLTALAVTALVLGERLAIAQRWRWYFRVGMPLAAEPVPIPAPPEKKSGLNAGLRWDMETAGRALWSAERTAGGGIPAGLHGTVDFVAGRSGVGLVAQWCPPWTPFLALAWFAALGASEGQGFMAGPVAVVISAVLFLVFQESAVRAVARLRFVWASGADRDDD